MGKPIVDARVTKDSQGKFTITLDHYEPQEQAFIPVEFAVAAYRFGHSMIRPRYDLNDVIVANIFGKPGDDPLSHLGGGRRLPDFWQAKWALFFKFPSKAAPQPSRKINAKLTRPLFQLPGTVVSSQRPELHSLAVRNLLRGKALGLPSGQAVATAVGATPITNTQLGLSGAGWDSQAPLWFYILKEAQRAPQSGTAARPGRRPDRRRGAAGAPQVRRHLVRERGHALEAAEADRPDGRELRHREPLEVRGRRLALVLGSSPGAARPPARRAPPAARRGREGGGRGRMRGWR